MPLAGLAVTTGPRLQTRSSMVLVTALIVLSLIDLDHMLLPDAITLPGIGLGLARQRPARLADLAAGGGGRRRSAAISSSSPVATWV